ncbi:ankyrin, partial [Karstenula rhodostoma CBS 690.94]
LLSHGARIHLTDSEGRTALHHAARVGFLQCVEALLNAGVDPNIADKNGLIPLHDVAYFIPSPEVATIVTSLHGYGADLEARNKDGWTPLFIATDLGSLEAVEALVECGA